MKRFLAVFGLALMCAPVGCGEDDDDGGVGPGSSLVGGSCASNGDCQDRCVGGGDWPGGMCTVSCSDDGDCPGGTVCVDKGGGVCALPCDVHADCDGFGPGWECDSTDRKGAPGDVAVCKG